jgi:heat shock protein HtpX
VMDTPALNAFASGMNQKQYAVTVTTGLLNALDDAEVEAVLGHELTHIRNGDVRMLVIAVIIAGVISFFAEMVFRMMFYSRGWGSSRSSGDSDRGKGGAGIAIVIAIALIAVAWFLSVVIRFALSRRREFLADAGSVELTKNPDAMISALRKIENRGELEGATSAVMEMCIDNPREGFQDLFATHPPVDKRVDALVRFAGGHDPGPLALPQFDGAEEPQPETVSEAAGPEGPWGPGSEGAKPFLPSRPPIELGTPPTSSGQSSSSDPGPWGPQGGTR